MLVGGDGALGGHSPYVGLNGYVGSKLALALRTSVEAYRLPTSSSRSSRAVFAVASRASDTARLQNWP